MKQLAIILILIFSAAGLFAQAMTARQIEQDLNRRYEQIMAFPYGGGDKIDSLEWCDSLFRVEFAYYTSHYPSTLIYPFDSLRKNYKVEIAASRDRLFRIYSWDSRLGGSMHDFSNVFQFKSGEKVYSKLSVDTSLDGHYDPGLWYSYIFTLKVNNKKYYLAIGDGRYSTRMAGRFIKLFTIEDHLLNDTVKLIKTKEGPANSVGASFDIFSPDSLFTRPLYDSAKKIIAVPLTDKRGKITGKYNLYQFTGKYFEPIQKNPDKNTANIKL